VHLRDMVVDFNSGFDSVALTNNFDMVPLVFPLTTDEGGNPPTIRVQHISRTRFDTDTLVSRFRLTLGLRFSGYDGSDIPKFNIVYRLRVQ
jgi:hypothetical protein